MRKIAVIFLLVLSSLFLFNKLNTAYAVTCSYCDENGDGIVQVNERAGESACIPFYNQSCSTTRVNINIPPPRNAPTNLGLLIASSITLVLVVSLLATFAYLVWGGVAWITSGGDKSQVEAARNRIQAAILGLFIVFASFAVMKIIASFFGMNDFPTLKFPTGV